MVHMDIKSANVLLQDKTCRVAKIADMGVSRYLMEGSLLDYTLRGVVHQTLCSCCCMSGNRTPRHCVQACRTARLYVATTPRAARTSRTLLHCVH